MKHYILFLFNQERLSANQATLFSTMTGKEMSGVVHRENIWLSLDFSALHVSDDCKIFLFSKPGGASVATTIRNSYNILISNDKIGEFLGYILLVDTCYVSNGTQNVFENGKWVTIPYSGYPIVEKTLEWSIPHLAQNDPDSPFIVASFGHEKEGAMSPEDLRKTFNLPDIHPIMPIDLESKADGISLIVKLFELNGFPLPDGLI